MPSKPGLCFISSLFGAMGSVAVSFPAHVLSRWMVVDRETQKGKRVRYELVSES